MNHIFLIGAGFTRAVYGQEALLTNEIMGRLSLGDFPDVQDLVIDGEQDIEQFITLLDLKCLRLREKSPSEARRYSEIRETIVSRMVNLFDYKRLNVTGIENHPLLAQFVRKLPNGTAILSLNYDCVLDQALWLRGRWTPNVGYGFRVSSREPGNDEQKDGIILLKLHGSCNFRNSTESDGESMKKYERYFKPEITNDIFPGVCSEINPRCSDLDTGPHVLVMSYVKKYHNGIMRLWRQAIDALADANRLTIIGCSLRDEDVFLRFPLYHFGMKEGVAKFQIDIVDKEEEDCRRIEEKVRGLVAWPEKQNIIHYEGLDHYIDSCAP